MSVQVLVGGIVGNFFSGSASSFLATDPLGFGSHSGGCGTDATTFLTVVVSGILIFLSNSVLLLFLLAFDFDFFNIGVFRPYSLICYGLLGLWLAIGLDDFIRRSLKILNSKLQELSSLFADRESIAFQNLSKNDRFADNFAEQHAELIFQLLPENSVFLSMVIPKQDHLATIIMLRSDDPTWSC